MDKIWYRNPSKAVVAGMEKNDKSRTLKKSIKIYKLVFIMECHNVGKNGQLFHKLDFFLIC